MMKFLTISLVILCASTSWAQKGISITTAFSPNGDGVNDIYDMPSGDYVMKEFSVFNRWGEKVFSSDSRETSWNGTHKKDQKCANGVYYFVFDYEIDSEKLNQAGNITLIR